LAFLILFYNLNIRTFFKFLLLDESFVIPQNNQIDKKENNYKKYATNFYIFVNYDVYKLISFLFISNNLNT